MLRHLLRTLNVVATLLAAVLINTAGCNKAPDSENKQDANDTPIEQATAALSKDDKDGFHRALLLVDDIDSLNSMGSTLLHTSLLLRQEWAATALIQRGANVNIPDSIGCTPLEYAVDADNVTLMRLLVQAGAQVNGTNPNNSPILTAVRGNKVTALRELLKMGADISIVDSYKQTLFQYAAQSGYWEVLTTLLQTGCDAAIINQADGEGRTPLHEAALDGMPDIVRQLLAAGANAHAKDIRGLTPLAYAQKKLTKKANNQNLQECVSLLEQVGN